MTSLVHQDPRRSVTALYRRVRSLLTDPSLKRFRAVVAYVRWEGLAVIADVLEAHLSRGGIVETIYGVDNGVTTPDALLYARYLQERYQSYSFAGAYEWEYSDSIFHPKLFEFNFGGRLVAIIGSANFTGGGLLRNHELGAELEIGRDDPARKSLRQLWTGYRREAKPITSTLIHRLVRNQRLSSERQAVEAVPPSPKRKRLGIRAPHARAKPLFLHLLKADVPAAVRHEILAEGEALSEKPRRLYLQVLGETGGGHQVQLPVATLGSFFGVGKGQSKPVSFQFDGEEVNVHLTHFGNNTHRVRLRPLQGLPRPAILIFTRMDSNRYRCTIVPPNRYGRTLEAKCPERTRRGSRRWGLEGSGRKSR